MKKHFLLSILIMLFSFSILSAQEDEFVNIPDENLKAALLAHIPVIDDNEDGKISKKEAEDFEGYLNLGSKSITSIEGLEAFVNVNRINLVYNNLTGTLDFSANKKLERLNCNFNKIDGIDVSENVALKRLGVTDNKLQKLDVSNNVNLERLWFYNNEIIEIDVSNNTKLQLLAAEETKLKKLDVSKCVNLLTLAIHDTEIDSIDVSNNPKLYLLNAWNAKLVYANVANGNNANMTRMKLYNNPDLKCIKHDEGFDPATLPCPENIAGGEGWCKDETAEYTTTECSNEDPEDPTAVQGIEAGNIVIFPNPTTDYVTLNLNDAKLQNVTIYNIQGVEVLVTNAYQISMQKLNAGLYFAKIETTDGKVVYEKIIKK